MIFEDIDWERVWIEALKNSPREKEVVFQQERWVKRWDDIAEKFDYRNKPMGSYQNNCYVKKIISRIEFYKDSTILDIGSGPGTLAIPLAKQVKQVTCIDMSKNMIGILKKNMKKEEITNITALNKRWEDVSLGEDIEKHDIVIASRSLGGLNLKNDLLKIKDTASKRAYISCLSKGNDFDRDVYEAVGKRYEFIPFHMLFFNLLYQLGINAEIDLFDCEGETIHKEFNEAYSYFKWHMRDLSSEEEERLKKTLMNLFRDGNQIVPESRWHWALISWSKGE